VSATMTDLVKVMFELKSLFDKYAGKDGDPSSLSKPELAQLLQIDSTKDEVSTKDGTIFHQESQLMDKFFSDLDSDKDGVVNFQEFVVLVATLCTLMLTNTYFQSGNC
uniref:Protein S100 n=1 Tax=Mola mola TaxID=94237 RepID=A0A3Q3XD20_MOLML